MINKPVKSLKELLTEEKGLIVPCVYDSASSHVAEMAGFKCIFLSGAELSMGMDGLPDLGILSLPELEWIVSRISDTCSLPLIVDAEDGFGSMQNVYRTCKRLAKAGAKGILLEDESEPGFAKGVVLDNILPREQYITKVRTAKAALEGTDCIFIARTNVPIKTPEGMAEAIARCKEAWEAGADMVLVNQLSNIEEARYVASHFDGVPLMFPDLNQGVDQPDVDPQELYDLGFNLLTAHFMMKGAMVGMLNYALRVAKDQNNLYTRDDNSYNAAGQSAHPFYPVQEWLDLEGDLTGVYRKSWAVEADLSMCPTIKD